jgi:hypothetical protein
MAATTGGGASAAITSACVRHVNTCHHPAPASGGGGPVQTVSISGRVGCCPGADAACPCRYELWQLNGVWGQRPWVGAVLRCDGCLVPSGTAPGRVSARCILSYNSVTYVEPVTLMFVSRRVPLSTVGAYSCSHSATRRAGTRRGVLPGVPLSAVIDRLLPSSASSLSRVRRVTRAPLPRLSRSQVLCCTAGSATDGRGGWCGSDRNVAAAGLLRPDWLAHTDCAVRVRCTDRDSLNWHSVPYFAGLQPK